MISAEFVGQNEGTICGLLVVKFDDSILLRGLLENS